MSAKSVAILRRTTYEVDRPETQNPLGGPYKPCAESYDVYDFRIDEHRKDMLNRIARTLFASYGIDSVSDIMRSELEGILKSLDPANAQEKPKADVPPAPLNVVWPGEETK